MNNIKNILTTDILVVGGGVGGGVTAIRAAKAGAQVLIADKVFIGGGGMSARAGHGIIVVDKNEEAIENFVEYHARFIGDYLDNQDMLREIASNIVDAEEALLSWGVKLSAYEDGKLGTFALPYGVPWKQTGIQCQMMVPLRKEALFSGVKFKEHFQITGLLKDGNRIAGACGFDIYDGSFWIINAKAVVLATAPCGYKNAPMFHACGEGNKLAYDVGAKMRSAEFGNFYENYAVRKGSSLYGSYPFTFNAKGENMWDKYVTWHAPDMTAEFYRGFVTEYLEGGGPMYIDMDVFEDAMKNGSDWSAMGQHFDLEAATQGTGLTRFFEDRLKLDQVFEKKLAESGLDLGRKPEVKIGMHGNAGTIGVDLDFQTSVPGLFAVGLTNYNGSGAGGAVGTPGMIHGNGVGHASFTGYICGPKVAEYAKKVKELPAVDNAQVDAIWKDTMAPMVKTNGYDAHDMISEVQDCITPIKYNLIREEGRLNEALEKLDKVKEEKLANLQAKDWHDLMVCNEIKSMAVTGEITMRCALIRKESRGFHLREDYTQRDDKNWLKWIVAEKKAGGKMDISTEDVPMSTYKYRPDNEDEAAPRPGAK